MVPKNLYLNFCNLRTEFISKLANWHLLLTSQALTAETLSSNLLSLTENMEKSFLTPQILNHPITPTCYRYRVNKIMDTLITAIESLQSSPEIVFTEIDVLSGILSMVVIQIGRLSIASETWGEISKEMDMMADVVDAQVSCGAFEGVNLSMVDEQCLLKEIWEWMHDVDPVCECMSCMTRSFAGLDTQGTIEEDQMNKDMNTNMNMSIDMNAESWSTNFNIEVDVFDFMDLS